MKRVTIFTIAILSAYASSVWAIDQVYTSTSERTLLGKVTGITTTAITFEKSGSSTEIPVNEVIRVTFENSPDALAAAQKFINSGDYADALASLKKIGPEETSRREVLEEIAYSKAFCQAQLALAGDGDSIEAGRQMVTFVTANPNSFHYLKSCELIGDLLVNAGRSAKAQEYYAKLAQAPWPDYKIRAQVALGRAFLIDKKISEATKAFNDAMQITASGQLADLQRIAAQIGLARCLAMSGNTDKAIHDVEQILSRNEGGAEGAIDISRNPEISAQAYNALGMALRKAGKPREALLAYLHVHLQFSGNPDSHAEAVANLAKLFSDTQKPEHAREMRALLDEQYHNNRWAKPGAID